MEELYFNSTLRPQIHTLKHPKDHILWRTYFSTTRQSLVPHGKWVSHMLGVAHLPGCQSPVTTKILICLVGDPYESLFATASGTPNSYGILDKFCCWQLLLTAVLSHSSRDIFWWNDGEVWSYWSSLLDNGNLKVCWNKDKPCQLPNGTFCIAQDGCFNGVNTPHFCCHDFLLKISHLWVPNFEAYYGDKSRGILHLQQHIDMLASVKSSSSKFNHAKVAKINLSFLGLGRTDDFLTIFYVEKLCFETNPLTTKPLVTVDLKKTPGPSETPSRSRPKVSSIVSHSYWVDPTGRFVQVTENRST